MGSAASCCCETRLLECKNIFSRHLLTCTCTRAFILLIHPRGILSFPFLLLLHLSAFINYSQCVPPPPPALLLLSQFVQRSSSSSSSSQIKTAPKRISVHTTTTTHCSNPASSDDVPPNTLSFFLYSAASAASVVEDNFPTTIPHTKRRITCFKFATTCSPCVVFETFHPSAIHLFDVIFFPTGI